MGESILRDMTTSLAIGDFARATHVSVKALRHYHDRGLLVPAAVAPGSGYRRYTTDQIALAQVIRRFRDLAMPLEQIAAVLQAPDLQTRNAVIATHLAHLEQELAHTQAAVASLQALLAGPPTPLTITLRREAALQTAVVAEVVALADLSPWLAGAMGELVATLAAQGVAAAGPPGAIIATDLFAAERGAFTLFVPSLTPIRPVGRVQPRLLPAVELATTVHAGSHAEIDRTYGALATYVTERALGIDLPIRERYLVGRQDTPDASAWRTEIGWPIFATGVAP